MLTHIADDDQEAAAAEARAVKEEEAPAEADEAPAEEDAGRGKGKTVSVASPAKPPKRTDELLLLAFRYFDRTGVCCTAWQVCHLRDSLNLSATATAP